MKTFEQLRKAAHASGKPWDDGKSTGRYIVILYHGGERKMEELYDKLHLAWCSGENWLMGYALRTPSDWKKGYKYEIVDNQTKKVINTARAGG